MMSKPVIRWKDLRWEVGMGKTRPAQLLNQWSEENMVIEIHNVIQISDCRLLIAYTSFEDVAS